MTSLQEKLAEMKRLAEDIAKELEKSPAPCPLEEGKRVRIRMTVESWKRYLGGYPAAMWDVSVEDDQCVLRTPWGNGLNLARELVATCGEKVD